MMAFTWVDALVGLIVLAGIGWALRRVLRRRRPRPVREGDDWGARLLRGRSQKRAPGSGDPRR